MEKHRKKVNIIFLEGLEPRNNKFSSFLGYLFSIASVLEKNNYSFKILNVKNLVDYSIQGIVNELKEIHFDAIGMTTNADNIRFVYKICDKIKIEFPKAIIILGGPHVTFADEKTLKECQCDVIVRNEGEIALIEILKCINENVSFDNIDGITYRKQKKIIKNKESLPLDINQLPIFQYDILSDKKYWIIPKGMKEKDFEMILKRINKSYPYYMTGRGCPYQCAFCVEGNIKRAFRFRTPDIVKVDLEYFLSKTNCDYVVISDDTFTSSPKRVQDLCSIFKEIQQKHPFIWFCEGRVDILSKYPELISTMYDAGLRKLQLGIESGNQKVLNIYNKKITLEQIEIVVKEAAKFEELHLHGNIIMGNPKETLSEYKESLNFLKHLILLSNFKLDISRTYLSPFLGTPIRDNPEKYEIEILIEDFEFSRFGMNDIVSKPKTLTIDELNNLNFITETELLTFIDKNVFNLPRKTILKYYREQDKLQMPSAITKSFGRLSSFKKYLKIMNRKTTINAEIVNDDLCYTISPLRLWDIEYNINKKEYSFIALNGEETIIDGDKVFLWEKATGKKSIHEIYEQSNLTSIDYILDFYKDLENKMALIFVEF